jgi:hypothetical protein
MSCVFSSFTIRCHISVFSHDRTIKWTATDWTIHVRLQAGTGTYHAQIRDTEFYVHIPGVSNPACQVARATEFCTVAHITCGSSVWKLLHVTLLALRRLEMAPRFFEKFEHPCHEHCMHVYGQSFSHRDVRHSCNLLQHEIPHCVTMRSVTSVLQQHL